MRINFFIKLLVLGIILIGFLSINQNIKAAAGGPCQDNPSGADHRDGYIWKADCGGSSCYNGENESTYHNNCPKNTSDQRNVEPETSNWCWGFGEGDIKDFRCLQLQYTGSGDYTEPGDPSTTPDICTGNVTTCVGEKSCASLREELILANYTGPWDQNSAVEAYNDAACPPGNSPTPSGSLYTTVGYRISETSISCDGSGTYQDYTGSPMTIPYTFQDTSFGVKTIYACFKYQKSGDSNFYYGGVNTSSTAPAIKTIRLAPPPVISTVTCSYSLSGEGTNIKIMGFNFGGQGSQSKIETDKGDAEITSWIDQPIISNTALSPTPIGTSIAIAASNSTVLAQLTEKIYGKINVIVTTNDGETVTGSCVAGVSSLQLNAKIACRPPDQFQADDVDLEILNLSNPTDQPIRQKISLNQKGEPQGINVDFNRGIRYGLLIKAPKSLAKRIEFDANEGTKVLGDIVLPVGDIAPLGTPDGLINALDKGELNREWTLTSDVSRTGDFNLDNRVNSIDWACMRNFYNKSDER